MPSILFLSQSLPFPPDSGGKQRTFHVLTELQREFDVHLVSFARRAHQAVPEQRARAEAELSKRLTRVLPSVPYPNEWSRARLLWDHGRSLLTGKVYSHFQYGVPEFGRRIDEALNEFTPELIHFDCIDFFPWFARFPQTPVTCTHHDIESHLLARRAGTARNSLLGKYIRLQARLMESVEREYCPRFELNLTMSSLDSERLTTIAPEAKIAEVPNAVDLESFPVPSESLEEENTVVFVGPTYLFANEDAAWFLVKEVWPRVLEKKKAARLFLVGKNTAEQKRAFSRIPGVTPLGWVDRIQEPVARAACSVIPIRVGGGTRIKILESWALGRAIVTTSIGGEGLAMEDGVNALVRDDPNGFADGIIQVLENRSLRRRLGQEGRRTVEESYNWRTIGQNLRNRYKLIISGSNGRDPASVGSET